MKTKLPTIPAWEDSNAESSRDASSQTAPRNNRSRPPPSHPAIAKPPAIGSPRSPQDAPDLVASSVARDAIECRAPSRTPDLPPQCSPVRPCDTSEPRTGPKRSKVPSRARGPNRTTKSSLFLIQTYPCSQKTQALRNCNRGVELNEAVQTVKDEARSRYYLEPALLYYGIVICGSNKISHDPYKSSMNSQERYNKSTWHRWQ